MTASTPGSGGGTGPPGRRDFEVIVCSSLDRIARTVHELEARRSLAHQSQIAIVSAEDLADLFPPAPPPARQLACEIVIAGYEKSARRRSVSPLGWRPGRGRRAWPTPAGSTTEGPRT